MEGESQQELAPPNGRRIVIDQPEQVPAVVERLLHEPVLGVDVEAGIPPRERHSRFALLQVAVPGDTYAIDPLRLRDLAAFIPVFGSEHVLKVFHGIGLDREMLESAGVALRYVADLSEVARSAYGKGEASLAAMTRRAFGIGMDKSLQRSEWLHRPLTIPLLAYACRDAELTLALYHWLGHHQPALLALHTSLTARPELPIDLPGWLTAVLGGSRVSVYDLLAQDGRDLERDTEEVLSAVRRALAGVREPFLRGRVLRAAGDLELYELAPLIGESLHALAAPERAAAARALATMGEELAEPAIRALLDDPTEEVRQAAEQALRILPERVLGASVMGESAVDAATTAD